MLCPALVTDPSGGLQFARVAWLGKGGFAAVWSVEQTRTAQRFALKVVNKATLDESPSARRKLVQEIDLHAPLRHRCGACRAGGTHAACLCRSCGAQAAARVLLRGSVAVSPRVASRAVPPPT